VLRAPGSGLRQNLGWLRGLWHHRQGFLIQFTTR